MKKGALGGIIAGVIIFGVIAVVLICGKTVPAGYAGVVYNLNGGIEGETLDQGWHFIPPHKKRHPKILYLPPQNETVQVSPRKLVPFFSPVRDSSKGFVYILETSLSDRDL